MEKIILIATLIGVVVYAAFNPVKADGFFIEGQLNRNLDTSTDYIRWDDVEGIIPIEGLATLSVGYSIKTSEYSKIGLGVSHTSNPWTSDDYGQNNIFIKACFGGGC